MSNRSTFLNTVLTATPHHPTIGETADVNWAWLDEGVVSFTPNTPVDKAVVISAGIHGNETAPIELLDRLYADIMAGTLRLGVKLLLILGNPVAIRAGNRFSDFDMNRLFCKAGELPSCYEAARAGRLEAIVTDFFNGTAALSGAPARYHYDLHTAIRDSLLPTFALLPYQQAEHDATLLTSLDAANLDALVYHNTVGHTFTQFTSTYLSAASATLELGKAKPFGDNDLAQFAAIDQVLRAVVTDTPLPKRDKAALRIFNVSDSIIKHDDDFVLHVSADAPNFTAFAPNTPLASERGQTYVMPDKTVYVLFPNPNVAKGLRAALVLTEILS